MPQQPKTTLFNDPTRDSIAKGTFYSERADEMWNRQIKVPKIVRGLLFSVSDINCSNKMVIFTFFYINQINLCKARTNRY